MTNKKSRPVSFIKEEFRLISYKVDAKLQEGIAVVSK